jgi:hypothetical protein
MLPHAPSVTLEEISVNGGNGKDLTYFQDDPRNHIKRSRSTSYILTQEGRTLLKEINDHISRTIKSSHQCNLPQEIQDNSVGIVNAGKELGDGDFAKGIKKTRDSIEYVDKSRKTQNKLFYDVLKYGAVVIVSGLVTLLVAGFLEKVGG